MRRLAMIVLACAFVVLATASHVRGDVCYGGQCPAYGGPELDSGPRAGSAGERSFDVRPICRIENTQPSGRSLGTGTLVDDDGTRGLVLSCAHLFREGTGTLVVRFAGGRAFAARLAKIDPAADLAALEIAAPGIEPVELAATDPQRGDPLVSCGYGGDGRLWCNRGQALGYVTTLGGYGRETLELSGTARLGDSGGPVFDGRGRLVAVLFGTNGRVVDGTFCGRIRRFLQGLSARFGRRRVESPPAAELTPELDLQPVPPAGAPAERPAEAPRLTPATRPRPPAEMPCPQAPEVEMPPEAESDNPAGPLETVAESWLAARLTALLISFGLPAGLAGVAGGAIVWLVMRRARCRLGEELKRLKGRLDSPADEAASVVERHHNRYVPYEVSLLDKAWAMAHARVGEKYPGAVPYLKIVEGVKDQLLSGNDEPQIS